MLILYRRLVCVDILLTLFPFVYLKKTDFDVKLGKKSDPEKVHLLYILPKELMLRVYSMSKSVKTKENKQLESGVFKVFTVTALLNCTMK